MHSPETSAMGIDSCQQTNLAYIMFFTRCRVGVCLSHKLHVCDFRDLPGRAEVKRWDGSPWG